MEAQEATAAFEEVSASFNKSIDYWSSKAILLENEMGNQLLELNSLRLEINAMRAENEVLRQMLDSLKYEE
jgi:hypothetical protein